MLVDTSKPLRVSHLAGLPAGTHDLESNRWAANAISLPSLTFLSNLRPSHAPLVIDHLANPEDPELRRQLWMDHFRGVIGKEVEEQVASWEAGLASSPSKQPVVEAQAVVGPKIINTAVPEAERAPLVVRFTTHDGEAHDVPGYEGESLMEIAKREGLGAVEGTCGGHCGALRISVPDAL